MLFKKLPKNLRAHSTEAEKKLWIKLRMKQFHGLKFRRQQPIENHIADFVCFEKRLIIELDGGQHADSASDAERTDILKSKGFIVLRFWNNDVMKNIEGVLQTIEQSLNLPSP